MDNLSPFGLRLVGSPHCDRTDEPDRFDPGRQGYVLRVNIQTESVVLHPQFAPLGRWFEGVQGHANCTISLAHMRCDSVTKRGVTACRPDEKRLISRGKRKH